MKTISSISTKVGYTVTSVYMYIIAVPGNTNFLLGKPVDSKQEREREREIQLNFPNI